MREHPDCLGRKQGRREGPTGQSQEHSVRKNFFTPRLNEKYYKKAKRPPAKSIIQAYKSMGFSPEFLEKIKKSFTKHVEQQKRIEKVIDKIFNKEPVKKPKKKKKDEEEVVEEEKEVEEDDPPEDDDEEDDTPGEDDGMDVEPEVEDDVEEPVEEEEYFSD